MVLRFWYSLLFIYIITSQHVHSQDILLYDNDKYHVTRGTFWDLSLGMNTANLLDEEDARVSTHLPFLYGYHFNSNYALALGTSFEFNQAQISGFTFDTQFVPLFVYGRYYLSKYRKRPFVYGRIGYGFRGDDSTFTNDHEGGVQYQGGFGVHFASRKKGRFMISLGYHLQKTNGTERFIDPFGNEISTVFNIWIRRWIVQFGFEFTKKRKSY